MQQLELLSNACAMPRLKKARTNKEKSTHPYPPQGKLVNHMRNVGHAMSMCRAEGKG